MNELNHTNGKGDKERSPGWRNNYDEIDFHHWPSASEPDGFVRRGNRLVKCYTPGRKAVFKFPELGAASKPTAAPEPLPCGGFCQHEGQACCNAASPLLGDADPRDAGWRCSRAVGHEGDHIACCVGDRNPCLHGLFRWPQGGVTKPTPADLSEYMLKNGVKL